MKSPLAKRSREERLAALIKLAQTGANRAGANKTARKPSPPERAA